MVISFLLGQLLPTESPSISERNSLKPKAKMAEAATKEKKMVIPDWTKLPKELLQIITDKMNCFDVVHARSVSTLWRSKFPFPASLLRSSYSLPTYPVEKEGLCSLEKIPFVVVIDESASEFFMGLVGRSHSLLPSSSISYPRSNPSVVAVRRAMALASTTLPAKTGLSLWCPTSPSLARRLPARFSPLGSRIASRGLVTASFANENREFVIIGGGNAAGYAARTFVENGMADGRLCIVTKEAYAPYERPALTKAYLFPPEKKPARLPGFHTCVGGGGERQTPDWYKEKGIEMIYEDPVTGADFEKQTLTTNTGKQLKYGSLIIATGCTASRFPDKIGGNLPGVHYIREVADADSLISSLGKSKKVVIVGGGYIGMEVAAAAVAWNLDTTIVFPEDQLLQRLFTPSLAQRYEELYRQNGVKFVKGASINNLEAGSDGRVTAVKLADGSTIEADTVVIGIGAKPAIGPFETLSMNKSIGGIQVDGLFRTSTPGIFAIGDVAAFPLKIYDRMTRVEHVDHARRSAQHCVKSLLTAHTDTYDYLPYFYSRVFEYEGSSRKVWWQFYGDNVGETVEVGNFDPKIATFWIDSGRLKGVLVESGSPEEFQLLPKLARSQPIVDKAKLASASSVEEALEIAQAALQS